MSDKYFIWLQELELRDQTYMQLGVLVLGLLLGWYLIGALIPAGWRDMVGKGYALMIAILYIVTLGATVFNG